MKKVITRTCDYGHRQISCYFGDVQGEGPSTCELGHQWVMEEENMFFDRARIQIVPLSSYSPGKNNKDKDPVWDEAYYLIFQNAHLTEKYMPRFVFSMGQIVEVLERIKKLPYSDAVKRVDLYCKHKEQVVVGVVPDHISGL